MNSDPSFRKTGTVESITRRAIAIVFLGCREHGPARPLVEPVEDDADRVLLLGVVLPHRDLVDDPGQPLRTEREAVHPREQHPDGRIERDGQERRDRHREVLRERERPEEPPFLVHEREHGQERDGDDEEREEHGRADLHERREPDLVEVPGPAAVVPLLQLVVRVLDLDDRAVHEDADRDRDAAERHDVDVQAHRVERDEREDDGDRNRHDRHDRARNVPEEHEDDDRDDDDLLDQLAPERVDGSA